MCRGFKGAESRGSGPWLGRDPIEEKGGRHLYAFVGNNGVNKWDYLGLTVTMSAFGSAPTRVEREVDGNGCEWEVIYSDMSDVAYGIPEWVEIGRTKISCGPVLIDSDPGRDGAPAAGDSSVPKSVPDGPDSPERWSDEKCRGIQARMASLSNIGKAVINEDMKMDTENKWIKYTGLAQLAFNFSASSITASIDVISNVRTAVRNYQSIVPDFAITSETRDRWIAEMTASAELAGVVSTIGGEAVSDIVKQLANLDVIDNSQDLLWQEYENALRSYELNHKDVLNQYRAQKKDYNAHCR